jgi:hypothetical protein
MADVSYTVYFDSRGGSPVASQKVLPGARIVRPPDPTLSGYRLVAWYGNPQLTVPWSFYRDQVSRNMTLYASWEQIPYLALEDTTIAAQYLVESNYTPESWRVMQSVLADANGTESDPRATDEQYLIARDNLVDAMNALQPALAASDKSALNALITKARALSESNYDPLSYQTLFYELDIAAGVVENTSAVQAEVDASLSLLSLAMADLWHNTVDKAALDASITDAGALKQADFTTDSWTTFATALSDARAVSVSTSPTAEQISTAYDNLKFACDSLLFNPAATVVSALASRFTTLVNSLPEPEVIQRYIPLQGPLSPIATLADNVRNQLLEFPANVDETIARLDRAMFALRMNNAI